MTPVLLAGVVAAGPERHSVAPVAATPVAGPESSAAAAAPRPVFEAAGARALRIPAKALSAYRKAELAMGTLAPGCGVSWNLLAGVGRLASAPAGEGAAAVRAVSSRADKLPSATWSRFASDGDGDGRLDPTNLFDATLATARHLCSSGLNFRDNAQALTALLRYNNSMAYAANVLGWAAAYATGTAPLNLPPIYGPVPVLGPYLPGRLWGLSQGGNITQAGYLLPVVGDSAAPAAPPPPVDAPPAPAPSTRSLSVAAAAAVAAPPAIPNPSAVTPAVTPQGGRVAEPTRVFTPPPAPIAPPPAPALLAPPLPEPPVQAPDAGFGRNTGRAQADFAPPSPAVSAGNNDNGGGNRAGGARRGAKGDG